eukprot:29849_1
MSSKSTKILIKCPEGHALNEFNTGSEYYICDKCGNYAKKNSTWHKCSGNDMYYLCHNCHSPKRKKNKKKKTNYMDYIHRTQLLITGYCSPYFRQQDITSILLLFYQNQLFDNYEIKTALETFLALNKKYEKVKIYSLLLNINDAENKDELFNNKQIFTEFIMSIILQNNAMTHLTDRLYLSFGRNKKKPTFMRIVKKNEFSKEMTLNIGKMKQFFCERMVDKQIQTDKENMNKVRWSCAIGVNYGHYGHSFYCKFKDFNEIKAFDGFGCYKKNNLNYINDLKECFCGLFNDKNITVHCISYDKSYIDGEDDDSDEDFYNYLIVQIPVNDVDLFQFLVCQVKVGQYRCY